jgi:predicted  nucleic acid-binding Zn-ribbon protein
MSNQFFDESECEKKITWIFTTNDRNLESFYDLLGKDVRVMNEPGVDGLLNLPRWSQNKFLPRTRLQEDQPHMRYDYFFHFAYKNGWTKFLRSMILKRIFSQYGAKNTIVIHESIALGTSEIVSTCLPNSKIIFLVENCKSVIKEKINALDIKEKKLSKFLQVKEKLADKIEKQKENSDLVKREESSNMTFKKISEMQENIKKLIRNIQISRDIKNTYEGKIEKFKERIENRNRRINVLKKESSSTEEAILDNERKINEFNAKINELETNLGRVSSRLENQEKKLETLQYVLREREERKQKIVHEISQYDSRIEKIEKEIDKINAKVILEDATDKRLALVKLWSNIIKTYLKVYENRNGKNCKIVKIEELSDSQKARDLIDFVGIDTTNEMTDVIIQSATNDGLTVELTDEELQYIKESAENEMKIFGY